MFHCLTSTRFGTSHIFYFILQAYNDLLGGITQSDLNVTSTVRSRTYQSAVAFGYGLLGDSVDYNTLDIQHTTSTVFCRNERAVSVYVSGKCV